MLAPSWGHWEPRPPAGPTPRPETLSPEAPLEGRGIPPPPPPRLAWGPGRPWAERSTGPATCVGSEALQMWLAVSSQRLPSDPTLLQSSCSWRFPLTLPGHGKMSCLGRPPVHLPLCPIWSSTCRTVTSSKEPSRITTAISLLWLLWSHPTTTQRGSLSDVGGPGWMGWAGSQSHLCNTGLSFSPQALGWDRVGAAPSPPASPGQDPKQPTRLPHRLDAREPYIPGRTEATEAERSGWGAGQGWEAHPRPDHTLRGRYRLQGPYPHRPRLGIEHEPL